MPDQQDIVDTLRQALPPQYKHLADSLAQEIVALAAGSDDARTRLEESELRDALRTLEGQSLSLDTDGDIIVVGDIRDSKATAIGRNAQAVAISDLTITIVPPAPPPLSAAERASALSSYRQRLLDETALISIDGIPLPRDQSGLPIRLEIQLDRVYIRLQALSEEHARRERDAERHELAQQTRPTLPGREHPRDDLGMLRTLGEYFYRQGIVYEEQSRLRPVDPSQALREHHRLVILGPPGAGKSTLLRFLARDALRSSDDSLPILIPLREYATVRGSGNMTSLRDFALDRAAGGNMVLRQALAETPRKLWLLDALDEAHAWRNDVARQVVQLEGDVVLTSRPLDYQPGSLSPLLHFEVLPLAAEDVDRFMRTWLGVLAERGGYDAAWVRTRVTWLRGQLAARQRIARLVRSPLLLTFLVILAGQDPLQALPTHRAELYRRYMEVLIDSWEVERRPRNGATGETQFMLGGRSGRDARDLGLRGFYRIGWYLHLAYYSGQRDYQPTMETLLAMLARYLGVQQGVASDIIRFWQEAGLIDEWTIGATTYLAFRHLTFQEYAAARGLADVWRQDAKQGWLFLQPRLHHYAWSEPILLLSGTLITVEHQRALMRYLIQGGSRYEQALHRDLRLAATLLGEGMECLPTDRNRLIRQLEYTLRGRASWRGMIHFGVYVLVVGMFIALAIVIYPTLWILAAILAIGCVATLDWHPRSHWIPRLPTRLWPTYLIRNAAEELGRIGDPQAVCVLLQALHDAKWDVVEREAAAKVLGGISDPQAVLVLLQALHDAHPHVHEAAAGALGRISDPQAVPVLLQALHDADEDVRWTAAGALGRIGDSQAVPVLLQALHNARGEVRSAAAAALGGIREPQAVPALIQALHDPEWVVRSAAAAALGGIREPQAVPTLIQALHDPEWVVRRAATKALGDISDPQAVPVLLQALLDEDWGVRRMAAVALGRISDPQAVPVLLQALHDADEDVRGMAAEMLGRIGDPQAVPVLLQALHDPEWEVRKAATEVLGRVGDPQAVPALIQALQDADEDVRGMAAAALGRIGDPQAVPALLQAFHDADDRVRLAATKALGGIGDSQVVPALLQALHDADRHVHEAAAGALEGISDAQAVPVLLQALHDADRHVRWTAAGALGRIGDSQAVPVLLHALHDAGEDVRSRVAEALGHIGDPQAVPALIQALHDAKWVVRRAAAAALGGIREPQAVPALIQALHDAESEVCNAAAKALGSIDDPQVVPAMLQALHHSDQHVRWKAINALRGIGEPQVVPALIQALHDAEEGVRWTAAIALGDIGDPQAVPTLIQALHDPEWEVRRRAVISLGQLSERIQNKRVLNRVAWALWKRLTEGRHITDAALPALKRVADRLAVHQVEETSSIDPLLPSPRYGGEANG